jgi:hypothetical protein
MSHKILKGIIVRSNSLRISRIECENTIGKLNQEMKMILNKTMNNLWNKI